MQSLVNRNATNDAQDLQEDFFVTANEERVVLKLEIDKLNVANLSPEQRAAMAYAKPLIEEAQRLLDADTDENKINFVKWLYETHIPEDKRKGFADDATTANAKKFARWCVRSITKHIHPDGYVNDPNKKYFMAELQNVFNKVVNKLKGH